MLSTMVSKGDIGGGDGAEPFLNSQQIDKSAAAVKSCIFKAQASNLRGGKLELQWHAPEAVQVSTGGARQAYLRSISEKCWKRLAIRKSQRIESFEGDWRQAHQVARAG